ncbi:MAG: hypothetical protein IJE46_00175 [Clostridia bacterium]|nr:hypothetical protein [Clostridia bacterium]
MINYNLDICANSEVNSKGYKELMKVVDFIAEKCHFEKEVIIEDNMAKEINLKYIKNNEVIKKLTLGLEELNKEQNVIGLDIDNKTEMVLNPDISNIVVYVCEYAEKIVEFDFLSKVYELVCERTKDMPVKFKGEIVGDECKTLKIRVYSSNPTEKDYLLDVLFRLDYDEDIYGHYESSRCESEDMINIEIANEDIDFLVNACIYHIEDLAEVEE